MANKNGTSPEEPTGMDDAMREKLADRVLGIAWAKAEKLETGEKVEVTLAPSDIPKGAHYGELPGTIVFRAREFGLHVVSHHEWTYVFTKV